MQGILPPPTSSPSWRPTATCGTTEVGHSQLPCSPGASRAREGLGLLERAAPCSLPPPRLILRGAPCGSRHRPHLKSSAAEGPGSGMHSPGHQDPRVSRPPARPARGQLAAVAPFSSRPESAWRARYQQLPAHPAAGTPTAPSRAREQVASERSARQSPLTHPEDEVKSEEQVFDALATPFDRHDANWTCVGQEARATGTEGTCDRLRLAAARGWPEAPLLKSATPCGARPAAMRMCIGRPRPRPTCPAHALSPPQAQVLGLRLHPLCGALSAPCTPGFLRSSFPPSSFLPTFSGSFQTSRPGYFYRVKCRPCLSVSR